MFDLLFSFGQAAAALLLVYGAVLVMLPQRKRHGLSPAPEPMRLRYLYSDG